jgi:hypothetical protein
VICCDARSTCWTHKVCAAPYSLTLLSARCAAKCPAAVGGRTGGNVANVAGRCLPYHAAAQAAHMGQILPSGSSGRALPVALDVAFEAEGFSTAASTTVKERRFSGAKTPTLRQHPCHSEQGRRPGESPP